MTVEVQRKGFFLKREEKRMSLHRKEGGNPGFLMEIPEQVLL